jgi:hypothetical protein
MYVNEHKRGKKGANQPTIALRSKDGIVWKEIDQGAVVYRFLFDDLFYLTVPVQYDGYYYALAKIQENGIGALAITRGKSLKSASEKGPILARGVRHCDVHAVDSILHVFFTMIGDAPERILLGTIDMSSNWIEWLLLPGPVLLSPEHGYEHGNAATVASQIGTAGCTAKNELRDPHFLPDKESPSDSLTGLLFCTVQGERAFAMARFSLNTTLHKNAVPYRNQARIDSDVLQASSLKRNSALGTTFPSGSTLITGTGRSGTTYLCSFFNSLNISISHDNDVDCGPYPGPDGAVPWYDAFDDGRRYDHVLHVVRNPLRVIQSRAYKMLAIGEKYLLFMANKTSKWEDPSELNFAKCSTKTCSFPSKQPTVFH